MAVKIRLRQQGRSNRQTYRLVAIDSRTKRDGKYLENLGWYDPFLAENNAVVDSARTLYWLGQGAEMSHEAEKLLARLAPDVVKQFNEKREQKKVKAAAARRTLRKAKAKTA
jgi:small subunit ribosomal protein S16